jgi:aspartate ammonia-lyase
VLDARRCNAIVTASERVRRGELDAHFVVDALQGGAGTSSNMNANEVIANVALLSLGHVPGRYEALHPNDHVNASQSTNDVYPSALRLALRAALQPLLHEAQALQKALRAQAARHAGVMKIGRTQLQDAVPMTVGQEFGAWAATVAGDTAALQRAALGLHTLNLGGTAVGTGVNAPPGFGRLAIDQLARLLGRPLQQADDLVHAGQDTASLLDLSAALRRVAVHLGKIASDLRLLGSGPQAGFGDLRLPPRQAGSSIMPGKVNPVIPEAVNQVAFAVIGGDVTVALACEAGQLQLNAFEPLIGATLLQSLGQLARAMALLRTHCIDGIEVPHEGLAARELQAAPETVLRARLPMAADDGP